MATKNRSFESWIWVMVALLPACSPQTASRLAEGPSSFEVPGTEPLVHETLSSLKAAIDTGHEVSFNLRHDVNEPTPSGRLITALWRSNENSERLRTQQKPLDQKEGSFVEKRKKKRPTNFLALSSMVLGILAVIPPFSFLFLPAMAALTMGAFALRKIKRAPWGYSGKWMAIIGIMGGLLGSLFMMYQIAIAAFTIGTLSLTIFAIPLIVNMIVAAWLLLSA
ncbi:MAG: hypothetical protein C0424_08150 [Sphingobacteriaceae bacterium]|nr:hypothetical protein [Sphingobacteriaceae bacterium]